MGYRQGYRTEDQIPANFELALSGDALQCVQQGRNSVGESLAVSYASDAQFSGARCRVRLCNYGEAMRNMTRRAARPSKHSEQVEGIVSRAATIVRDHATKLRTILWHLTLQIQTR